MEASKAAGRRRKGAVLTRPRGARVAWGAGLSRTDVGSAGSWPSALASWEGTLEEVLMGKESRGKEAFLNKYFTPALRPAVCEKLCYRPKQHYAQTVASPFHRLKN